MTRVNLYGFIFIIIVIIFSSREDGRAVVFVTEEDARPAECNNNNNNSNLVTPTGVCHHSYRGARTIIYNIVNTGEILYARVCASNTQT